MCQARRVFIYLILFLFYFKQLINFFLNTLLQSLNLLPPENSIFRGVFSKQVLSQYLSAPGSLRVMAAQGHKKVIGDIGKYSLKEDE